VPFGKVDGRIMARTRWVAGEFDALIRQTSVPTPAIDRLRPYLDLETPPMADGSAGISLRWGGLFAAVAALAIALAGIASLIVRLAAKPR
jgi:hypothetical protein